MDPINLTTTPEQEPINLDQGQDSSRLSPIVASSRAAKAEYGLGSITGHTYDDAHQAIVNGNEDQFRNEAAGRVDAVKRMNTSQLSIQQLIEHTDPKSVIEKMYGQQYLKLMTDVTSDFVGNTPMKEAIDQIPEHVTAAADVGSTMVAKREMLLTRAHNMEEAAKKEPWGQYITENVAGMVPFYQQLLTRSQVPVDVSHILPGENLAEQSKTLYRMPIAELPALLDNIENTFGKSYPGMAAGFFHDLAGMSTDEEVLSDQAGLIDIATVAAPTAALARKIKLYNHVQQATQDAVRSAAEVGGVVEPPLDADMANWENEGGAVARQPIKATNASGVGDLREAATQKAANNLVQDFSGKANSEQRAIEALLSEHRVDIAELKATSRPEEQELVNRIEQSYNDGDHDVIQAVSKAMKVNRTPLLETSADVVRAIEQSVKDKWSGLNNQILDIDTKLNHVTNTYEHEIKLGNPDGTYFSDRYVAEANAELNGLVLKPEGPKPWQVKAWEKKVQDIDLKLADPKRMEWSIKGLSKQKEDLIKKLSEVPQGEGYTVEQQGNGYYIYYTKPLHEDAAFKLRDKDYNLSSNPPQTTLKGDFSPWKWLTTPYEQRKFAHGETPFLRDQGILKELRALFGWGRTPDETLPRDLREQLKVGTHALTKQREPAVKMVKEQKALVGYKYWDDFNRILKEAQNIPDPQNGNVPGYYFRSIGELKNQYLTTLKRLPTDGEVQGYFVYKRAQDYDLFQRRLALYIPKSRVGAQQHQFSIPAPNGQKITSNFFEGITHPGLPGGEDYILNANTGKIYKTNNMPTKLRNDLTAQLKMGQQKVLEALDPDMLPFKNMSKEVGTNTIRYVITNDTKVKPLSLVEQLPRRGGGHLMPDYEHVLKQAQVRRTKVGANNPTDRYVGDATGAFFNDRVTGKEHEAKWNKIREHLNNGDKAAAKAEHEVQKMPMDWKEFHSWFKPSRTPDGEVVEPRFSTKEPFHLLKLDETIGEKDKDGLFNRYPKTYEDGTKTGSIARTFKVEFSGVRDAHELKAITDVGGRNNPVYKYEPAKYVDPITAQNRGLSRIINSNTMNDVKTLAMNKWLRDAQPYLAAKPSEIWHSPWYYFNKGDFLSGFAKNNLSTYNILRSNKLKIDQFLGKSSVIDNFLHSTAQELADNIHGAVGPRLVPTNLLSKVSDPLPFVRTMTSHSVLGLGSVKQFWTQATAHTNIWGMSPRSANAGTMATLLHSWTAVNSHPNIIAHLDSLATKMRIPGMNYFKPGEFTEAHDLINRSGFITVAEEHALANNLPGAAKLVKSAGTQMLDLGMTPFKWGAESVRASAGYTAYLEMRAKYPTGRITRAMEAEWLDRASLLDHNMSRASNSVLHTGVMSIPGQFFAYDLRLSEIMWGKRISPLDKARLFTTSAIMYGIPATIGMGSIVPLYKYIRKQMEVNQGYVVGDNFVKSVLMEGLPSMIGAAITSHDGWNPQYGNWYDFSKFGVKGLDYIDALNSDVSFWKIVGGAAGTWAAGAFKNTSNLRAAVMPHLLGGVDGFHYSNDQILDVMKTFSSGDQAWKGIAAFNTGKWFSNNGTVVDEDVSKMDAAFMALTGTQHVEYLDQYIKQEQMRDRTGFEQAVMAQFVDNFRKSCFAADNNDPQQAKLFMNNAFAILDGPGGYPEELKPQAIARACDGLESTIRAIDKRFYSTHAPAGQEDQLMDAWKATIRRQEGMGK